jgi:hypothetical protein
MNAGFDLEAHPPNTLLIFGMQQCQQMGLEHQQTWNNVLDVSYVPYVAYDIQHMTHTEIIGYMKLHTAYILFMYSLHLGYM